MSQIRDNHANDAVLIDTPCVRCGYNLRGTSRSACCPECACPVRRSGEGYALRHADATWLGRVYMGVRLLIWAGPLGVAVVTLMVAVVMAAPSVRAYWWAGANPGPSWPAWVLWTSWHLWWAYCIAAIVLLTAQEPRLRFAEGWLSLRRMLRIFGIVTCIFWTGQVDRLSTLPEIPGSHTVLAYATDMCAAIICMLVGAYMARIAERTRDSTLGRHTVWTTRRLACVILIVVAVSIVAQIRGEDRTDLSSVVSVAYTVSILGVCVFFFVFIRVLMRYSREFRLARDFRRIGGEEVKVE